VAAAHGPGKHAATLGERKREREREGEKEGGTGSGGSGGGATVRESVRVGKKKELSGREIWKKK
jgi:hypothetical protein